MTALTDRDDRRTRGLRMQRRLGKKAYRIAQERAIHLGFAIRSNPVFNGPTPEFPGVDIDAIHYKRGAIRQKKAA